MKGRQPSHPQGISLVECLATVAISAIVLAGLAPVLGVTLDTYKAAQGIYQQRANAHIAMARIVDAILVGGRKSTLSKLGPMPTSGDWLDGTTSDGKLRKISYTWSSASNSLSEHDDLNKINQVILSNVTGFGITVSPSNDDTLVTVALTMGSGTEAVRLTETVRLGGAK